MSKKRNIGKKGAAATGVAAVALLAVLFGTGKLGFGTGTALAPANNQENAPVIESAATTQVKPETTVEAVESEAAGVEIRIQGRTYNYQNVSYGSSEHTLDELLTALREFPPDTRITLIVESDATKNAVDELERALTEAGFTTIVK